MTRAFTISDVHQLPAERRTETRAAAGALHLKAEQLCKVIDERAILRDVSLEIFRGDFVALLGANGAGKSTLFRILSTLNSATSGTLELLGLRAGTNAAAIRAKIGLVSHQSMLYGDLTALENLTFFGRLYGVKEPAKRAAELLATLGLKQRANDRVKSFSRGMAQRVAIARALVHDPELLLADEPFAGLDAPSAAVLEKLLTDLNAAGKTILLANHDIAQSLRLARRAVILFRGRKIADVRSEDITPGEALLHMEGAAE